MFRIILFSVFVTFIFSSCSDQNKELSSDKVISIKFTKTTDGTEFKVSGKQLEGTPAEAEFFKTGKNIYVGDAKAEKRGKKRFGYWSCTQCHGPTAKGQVGPGLVGPTFKYPKNATNKGMFETAWFGTNGGMGGKGYGIMAPEDGLTVDELLKIIAWVRTNGKGITGNEDLNEQ